MGNKFTIPKMVEPTHEGYVMCITQWIHVEGGWNRNLHLVSKQRINFDFSRIIRTCGSLIILGSSHFMKHHTGVSVREITSEVMAHKVLPIIGDFENP